MFNILSANPLKSKGRLYNEYNEDIDNSISDTNSTKDSDNSDSEWAVV